MHAPTSAIGRCPRHAAAASAVMLLAVACSSTAQSNESDPAKTNVGKNTLASDHKAEHAACGDRASPQAMCGDTSTQGHDAHDHAGHPTRLLHDKVRTQTDADGKTITIVGKALTNAPTVPITKLLGDSSAYAGKRVRIEGHVAAMCTHRRMWYALVGEGDAQGQHVRVITAPSFLVPRDAVGKNATAEGTVEVIQINAAQAKHYSEMHKLHYPETDTGTLKRVVIRATGSTFK